MCLALCLFLRLARCLSRSLSALSAVASRPIIRPTGPGAPAARSLTTLRVAPSAPTMLPAVVSFPAMPGVVTSALVGLPVAVGALLAARVILIALAEPLMVPGRAITPHTTVSAAFRRAGRVG
ncbi:hypothetical protein [Microtetraspora malaysiensis]|uniref:Secreted protein n=1 Tax=Microtetraspora malaysiensis TaxID=161358 RepID=A0ABW6T2G7_9ACTN